MVVATLNSSVRFRVGTILTYLVSLILAGSAAAKFAQVPQVTSKLAVLGFEGSKLILIAALELTSAILFAIPRTRSFGLLMASAYLGGAVAAHVAHDQMPLQPSFVLALLWLAVLLRHLEARRSSLARTPA